MLDFSQLLTRLALAAGVLVVEQGRQPFEAPEEERLILRIRVRHDASKPMKRFQARALLNNHPSGADLNENLKPVGAFKEATRGPHRSRVAALVLVEIAIGR